MLRSCYTSCLEAAQELEMRSLAFCCISTGVFSFPQEEAAEIAAGAVMRWKMRHPESRLRIIFNTFLDRDTEIYQNILSHL